MQQRLWMSYLTGIRFNKQYLTPCSYFGFASPVNVSKGGPDTYDLARRKVDKLMKQAPAVKRELEK